MARKVIQIAVVAAVDAKDIELYWIQRTALCDDGTMWVSHGGEDWKLISDVPQKEKE